MNIQNINNACAQYKLHVTTNFYPLKTLEILSYEEYN